jgi:hypothetical protein
LKGSSVEVLTVLKGVCSTLLSLVSFTKKTGR